jgi:hypothetical protein
VSCSSPNSGGSGVSGDASSSPPAPQDWDTTSH